MIGVLRQASELEKILMIQDQPMYSYVRVLNKSKQSALAPCNNWALGFARSTALDGISEIPAWDRVILSALLGTPPP